MGSKTRTPWAWIPSLYFAEGLPYVVVATPFAIVMYKRLGISNADITLYTSLLYLPWIIKPIWSPFIDLMKTKKWWIIVMQLLIGAGFAGIALTIPATNFFRYTLAFFWLIAFNSATHDIAADGFYMLALDENKQAFFVGIRSTFYRLAMITGQGLLIILAGSLESRTGLDPVRFEISSSPTQTSELSLTNSDQTFSESSGDLKFILSETKIKISTEKIPNDRAAEIIAWVKSNNLDNGFLAEEKQLDKKQSWWTGLVSEPLKNWLKRILGRNDGITTSNTTGNMAMIGVHLSTTPGVGENIILNLGRESGNKNFNLIHGERLVFTNKNWNKNAWVLVQLDPKFEGESSAVFEGLSGNIPFAWSVTFYVLAGMFVLFFVYHRFVLPHPAADVAVAEGKNMMKEFWETFVSYFRKENIGAALAFLLLFRLGESQLVKLATPFLLDSKENDGLGLTTSDIGLIYGTIGIIALTVGGILGGYLASKKGLKYWIWWMTIAINLPNLVYVYLSYAMPSNIVLIATSVAVEQFGYGFGFTAYMLYMIMFAEGKSKTAHYAICTGFMALGMMIPGMFSGWLQEIIGYQNFFIWVMICTLPGFFVVKFLKIDPKFGIKKEAK